MKKPPFISHFLVIEDLKHRVDISTTDGAVYFCRRLENIFSEFRKEGVIFNEHNYTSSKFSNYKIYQIIYTPDNLNRLLELQKQYAFKMNNWLSSKGHKDLSDWLKQQNKRCA
jgi:UDP:flavonoid glycosyltransferase YjiC (YdhE family)